MERIQLEYSDIISFHNYDNGPEFEKRILWLQRLHRPIVCTEYMARGNGSTFQGSLPIAKKYNVGAINWGFVAGKTQTVPAVGFVEEALRRSRAHGLVPRDLQAGPDAVQAGRGRSDPFVDRRQGQRVDGSARGGRCPRSCRLTGSWRDAVHTALAPRNSDRHADDDGSDDCGLAGRASATPPWPPPPTT